MVVLGGLKPLRLSSSSSGEAGASRGGQIRRPVRDSPAEEMSRILLSRCHGAF